MSQPDADGTETVPSLNRPRLFEDVRVRLATIAARLSNAEMETAQLRSTAQELETVARRIQWLADVGTPATGGRR